MRRSLFHESHAKIALKMFSVGGPQTPKSVYYFSTFPFLAEVLFVVGPSCSIEETYILHFVSNVLQVTNM